jgi:hypothetical protein
MAEDVAKTEQAGFLAHLVKPINFDRLHVSSSRASPAEKINCSPDWCRTQCRHRRRRRG